ncbi:hypothetical protein SGGMMB4_02179 [Sodalis glossinidius str. 'morsitans']|nr:hypothetical protein SGGMMB4_02179 [Sodalis glossinidius str. 'morsitans']
MVGTDDGNRTAVSSPLSPTMLKKTPLFYAAQDAYVKGFVVITDSLVKLLSCHDCADAKNRRDLAKNELLKQIILLSSPVNRFISLQHDVWAQVPKICSTNPKEVLTRLQVHYSNGLMTSLTQYAEKHRLTLPKEEDVNDFINLHAELKSAIMMNSADWLMLIIRDYAASQRACRDWHFVPYR